MSADITTGTAQQKTQRLRWLTSPLPLSWHLSALVASMAVPAVIFGAFLLSQQHQAELATIERDAMSRAGAISYASDAAVISIMSTLRAVGNQPALASADFSVFADQARRSFGRTGIIVTLRDEALKALKSTQDTETGLELTEDDAVLAREALDSGVAKVSDFSFSTGTAEPVVHVWVPVEAASPPRLLLDAMIPAASFNTTLLQSQIPQGWSAGLSDRHDRIIARTDDYERFVGQLISEETRLNSKAPAGIVRTTDLLGRPTLQAYLHSDLTGWRLATWAPRSLIEGRVHENWVNFLFMASALTALAIASAWLWARRMSSAVTELAKSAARLHSDQLLDDVTTPILEVNTLRDTVSAAAAELIRRKAALTENEERLRLALGAGGMGVWEWDPETDATHWDQAMFQQTGFLPDGAPGSGKAYLDRIHPDDAPRVQAAIAAATESGEQLSVDFRFLRPDGSMRWFAVRGALFNDRTGPRSRFMGVHFDITDEKEAAARTRALLLEVSHRSKNLLAVILAIGRLTARDAPSVRAYERALTLRVGALAASQDLIVASDWRGVDLMSLVAGQLNAVVQDMIASTRVSGPEVTLNPAAAQNLGMAIAELALNAMDHGALSNGSGSVTVSWELSPTDSPGQIALNWIERDGPTVTTAQKRGYGLAVVERLVAQSLKAKAELQFAAEGVRWSLTAPLESMVAGHSAIGQASRDDAGHQAQA